MNKGLFISFEGPEASGKSTQINLLKKFFKNKNISFIFTREPGGTKVSEKIRKILLDKSLNISQREEILLFMSSRLNLINNVIKPNLRKNKLVIADRFCDSSFVYQYLLNNLDFKKGQKLHNELLDNFYPKKTFLFLLDAKEIIKRLKKRKKLNKYDKININFHKKIINGYKKLSKNNNRFIIVDAKKNSLDIQCFIQKKIIKLLKK